MRRTLCWCPTAVAAIHKSCGSAFIVYRCRSSVRNIYLSMAFSYSDETSHRPDPSDMIWELFTTLLKEFGKGALVVYFPEHSALHP